MNILLLHVHTPNSCFCFRFNTFFWVDWAPSFQLHFHNLGEFQYIYISNRLSEDNCEIILIWVRWSGGVKFLTFPACLFGKALNMAMFRWMDLQYETRIFLAGWGIVGYRMQKKCRVVYQPDAKSRSRFARNFARRIPAPPTISSWVVTGS